MVGDTSLSRVKAREHESPFGTTRRDRSTLPEKPAVAFTLMVTAGARVPSARVTVEGLDCIVKSPTATTGVKRTEPTIIPNIINGRNNTMERLFKLARTLRGTTGVANISVCRLRTVRGSSEILWISQEGSKYQTLTTPERLSQSHDYPERTCTQ